jgi:hypothetical protein
MTKIIAAPLLLALVLLTACGGPRVEWVKEGADSYQLRQDREACAKESGGDRFQDDSRAGAEAGRTGGPEVYRLCMESRGWRRERIPEKPAASK